MRHARVKVYCCKQITTLNFSCYKHFKKIYMVKISNEVSIVVKINIYITIDGMYKIIGCTYGMHVFEEPHYEQNSLEKKLTHTTCNCLHTRVFKNLLNKYLYL